ncbi:MAG TPA: hypothetical protein VIC33_02755 [Vicinamibacterales bacterium]
MAMPTAHTLLSRPLAPASHRVRCVVDRLLMALFIIILILPLAASAVGLGAATDQSENHRTSSRPVFSGHWRDLAGLLGAWDSYFDDRFGLRATAIHAYNVAVFRWLHVSPSSTVLVGKDGWLFYADDGALQDFLSAQPFAPADLEQWRQTLQDTHDWLAARGITYVFVVAPDKHVIYPEYMPDGLHPLQARSRLDQLVSYLKQHTTVAIVDLRAPLLAAKTHERVFHRTDTHWNDLGAFVGYQSIMTALSQRGPALKPWPASAFHERVTATPGLDLARMLGLTGDTTEERLDLVPNIPRRARIIEPANPDPDYEEGRLVTAIVGSDLPRAVIFRDSFTSALIPFLSEHFSRAVYLWQNDFDPDVVEQEHPQIVIQELVGRRLTTYLPYDAVAR